MLEEVVEVRVKVPQSYLKFLEDYSKITGIEVNQFLEKAIRDELEILMSDPSIAWPDLEKIKKRYGIE